MSTEAELLRKFIDSSEAVIYLKDEEGRFLMVNKRGASVAGKKPEEVIGKTDYDYHSKEAADGFRKMDLSVKEAGKPITYKLKVQTPEGELTFIDHKFPVNVEGHPNSVGGIAIDITDVEG